MSSMLEQAIIDATALKEAAVKNAEAEILEKYSREIKEAVNSLLEIDDMEEDSLPMEELPAPPVSPSEEDFLEQIPLSATGGENLCACPDDDEMIEIDFTEIAGQMGEADAGDMIDRDEIAEETELLAEAEDIELEETDLRNIIEELVFDYEPTPSGWIGEPTPRVDDMQDVQRFQKELASAEKENKDLKKENKNLKEIFNENKTESAKHRRIVLQLKEKLDEVSLSNARLLYTNRVLTNASLNERQKKQIVESIAAAKNVEEAKIIFEALQSAVESSSKKPKSLNEAVTKKSSLFYARKDQKNTSDPFVERMWRLAGIKKGGN